MSSDGITECVNEHLFKELAVVKGKSYVGVLPELTHPEKALIHHYTHNGYKKLNWYLHLCHGRNKSAFGLSLVEVLGKLIQERRLVRSAIHLTQAQLAAYQVGTQFTWPSFLSTTTSDVVLERFMQYGEPGREKNAKFLINQKSGKDINQISYFGPNGPGEEENEVLMCPGSRFEVIHRIELETGAVQFLLKEI